MIRQHIYKHLFSILLTALLAGLAGVLGAILAHTAAIEDRVWTLETGHNPTSSQKAVITDCIDKALVAYEARLNTRFEGYEKNLETMKMDLIHKIEREIDQIERLIKGGGNPHGPGIQE